MDLAPAYLSLILIGLVSVIGSAALLSWRRKERRRLLSKAQEAIGLEETASQEVSLVDYIDAQLIAAAARQDVVVVTSASRADRLATTGFVLMVSSVLIPFGLVYLYLVLDPVEVMNGTAAPQRDWHLLLAGVSFGLLFIAAARGILTAEGRQRDLYGREVREVAYYGDLRRALGIAQRLDRKREDDAEAATEEVVRKIMALLLERDRAVQIPSAPEVPAALGDHDFLKIFTDVVKPRA
jgi:hypothetical protein